MPSIVFIAGCFLSWRNNQSDPCGIENGEDFYIYKWSKNGDMHGLNWCSYTGCFTVIRFIEITPKSAYFFADCKKNVTNYS